jgi:chromosome segregation ATPase
MQLTVSEKQKQAREMQSRMRVGEGPQSMFEEKERELQKMRETHETTMVRLKDRRNGIEEAMRGLRDQAQQTQVEVNRLRG